MPARAEPTATPEQARALWVAALSPVLAMISYTTPLATLAGTAAGLGSGPGGQAWILSSMSLGFAVGLLPAGALGDDHGRRRMFVVGALVLAATSVLAAVAPDTGTLVLARLGHGLGAAALLACSLGMIGHAFPPGAARLRATGVWGACMGAGIAVGPLMAAGLEAGLDWRAPYWAIAVLAVGLAVATRRLIAESTSDRRQPVDLAGMLLLGAALAGVLAGLVEVRASGSGTLVAGLFVAGVALAAVFVAVELRRRTPMIDLRLFGRPDFTGATVAALVTGAGVIAVMSFLPTLVQRGLGRGVVAAALILLGWSATSVLTALAARRLPSRISPRTQLCAGLLGVAAGQAMLSGLDQQAGAGRLLPGLLLAGAASGVLNAALARQAVASMPPGLAGIGSGANNTARYVGAAVGVTVVAVLAAHPDPAAMIDGWNLATLVTAGISVLGAVVVWACRGRAPAVSPAATPRPA